VDQPILRKIYHEIDKRSYALMKSAEQFVEQHNLLTASQASGLTDVANCVDSLSILVANYIQHQATRSTTKDKPFWHDLKREIEGLRKPAQEIQENLGLTWNSQKAQKDQLNQIQLLLARDYIQHLAAHEVYRKVSQEGNHDSLA
jgi:predicted membrane chloride channel (bestrophin family)